MDAQEQLARRVAAEQDDLLTTVGLVRPGSELADRLFSQLVDLLVEAMFLGLREEFLAGAMSRADYLGELGRLAQRCREAGLLPLRRT